ncbi:type I 3-dehydroquinate dehydratase [Caenimonas koreensis]|uniref:type I 3-dehydroquinate dehydratase n=1 Tax=Caenimonas koreensis TaxID=367474 RepID=UPI0037851CC6
MQARTMPFEGAQFPVICAPLVARTKAALVEETRIVAAKKPGLLEWRVDFFDDIANTVAVVDTLAAIREACGGIPVLFTRRSSNEGGEPIAIDEPRVLAMYRAVCESKLAALVDYEMSNAAADVSQVRDMSAMHGVKLVLSFHDFMKTPGAPFIASRFALAQQLGADVAKVAVMPRNMGDVLVLLGATLQANESLPIPVVSMAMGGFGALTRVCGWTFGSAMTFAVGQSSSAPGQMPIEEIEAGVVMLRRALGR